MKKVYYVMNYSNGNKAIIEKSEYEKEMREEYGIDATAEGYYDEAIVGMIESETEPTWDDLEYDEETGTYSLRENFDFLKTFDEKKVFTDTAWVAENDPEVYAVLHDMMLEFVEDESNQTTQEDLESFEAGEWCVEYFFEEDEGEITVSIYAGETWQDVANQPPWLEDTVTVEEFKENYPCQKYIERLED